MADPCIRVAHLLVSPDELTDWLHGAGHRDRIVYASGNYLPARCKVRDLAHAYARKDLLILTQPKRADGAGYDYTALRTAQPLQPRAAQPDAVTGLPDGAMALYGVIRLFALDADKLPDIKELARLARLPRVDVFGLMRALEDAGLVIFETWFGPVGRNWRVATLPDCGARTALPPEKWRK